METVIVELKRVAPFKRVIEKRSKPTWRQISEHFDCIESYAKNKINESTSFSAIETMELFPLLTWWTKRSLKLRWIVLSNSERVKKTEEKFEQLD